MQLAEAKQIANDLMQRYGLAPEWTFKFNKNKRRLGVCKQEEKRLELSQHYVLRNDREHIADTMLHEIAHALVGTEHGHDHVWKDMCIQLGCNPKSCDASADMPDGDWQARCPSCLIVFTRHRRPKKLRGRYCVACGPERGRLIFADVRLVTVAEKPVETSPRQLVLKFLFG